MWAAADWACVPRATVRTWYRRGLLQPKACHIPTRALLVDMNDVAGLAARRQPRSLTNSVTVSNPALGR